VNQRTIIQFEGARQRPYQRTVRDIVAALEAGGVVFVSPAPGEHSGGVVLRADYVADDNMDAALGATPSQDEGSLDALGWDWDTESVQDNEPLPPLDWTDEDRAEQVEHWRSRPEAWAKLHEVSRQCLLRAMGVERL
jgi:hypothetical protein